MSTRHSSGKWQKPKRAERGDDLRVLVACEFSGRVRDAFIYRNHDAWSCDLDGVEAEGEFSQYHLTGDVRKFYKWKKWDLMIAHPPCTYLANSGLRWLKTGEVAFDVKRWQDMLKAVKLFRSLLCAPIPRIAIENPIMHRYAQECIGQHYSQLIQPWEFGDGETKGTCLWLKGLPPLAPTKVVPGRFPRAHMASGKDQKRIRSITPKGIAKAMAAQWG